MRTHQADYFLISIIFALTIFGLVVLSSASVVISQEYFGQNYYFLTHQLAFGLLPGLIGFLICQKINYQYWQKWSFPLLVVGIILLACVFIPGIGFSHGGAKRWINLGFASFQPFEFVKLPFIIYLAALLSRKRKTDHVIKKSLIQVLIVVGIIVLLVGLQPNMSALIILFLIAILIYFLAGLKIYFLAAIGGLAFLAFSVLIKMNTYRAERLVVFLHPETDPQGIGYQINQALLAIGSGGPFGLGLGHSIQKWKYLPEVVGDSIFAIIAEELGFIGAGILVVLFVLLAWRGLRIAQNASDEFGRLVAGGITGWLFFQAFINIAAISGLVPLTGTPLPFISYGGSAIVVTLAGMGILTNISKHTH